MPKFIFAYHGGTTPSDPKEIERVMAEWMQWYGDMGDAVVDPGNPVGMSKTVTQTGIDDHGGANPLSGYTVVSTNDLDAALEMAKGCPMVRDGSGSVEVAAIHEM